MSSYVDVPARAPFLSLRRYRVARYVPELVVDVDFPAGVNVLLGVNGIGKTTLLRSLVLPELRAGGSEVTLRRDGTATSLETEQVCLLPQRPVLPRQLTVLDLVRYCCHLRGARTDRAAELLDQLGLSELADRRTGQLSGGQTQRLNLALSFVGEPGVALLDEPTVALDPLARASFGEALRSLTRPGAVVVMSTHVASDIDLADRVFLMASDRIAWEGTPQEFLAHSPIGQFDDAFAQLLSDATP